MRDEPTKAAAAKAGIPTFHPRWRWSTAAVAKDAAVCPDGNEYDVPSGRVRPTVNLIPCTIVSVMIWALTRSAPMAASLLCPVARPIEYAAKAPPSCAYVDP